MTSSQKKNQSTDSEKTETIELAEKDFKGYHHG